MAAMCRPMARRAAKAGYVCTCRHSVCCCSCCAGCRPTLKSAHLKRIAADPFKAVRKNRSLHHCARCAKGNMLRQTRLYLSFVGSHCTFAPTQQQYATSALNGLRKRTGLATLPRLKVQYVGQIYTKVLVAQQQATLTHLDSSQRNIASLYALTALAWRLRIAVQRYKLPGSTHASSHRTEIETPSDLTHPSSLPGTVWLLAAGLANK